jgi:hypothetical protein
MDSAVLASNYREIEMTLYVYDSETGTLIGRIHGETNSACEAKANEVFGSNDVEWSYAQKSELEFDGDAEDHNA